MKGQSYLVTGGGSGIGEATAEQLVALGAQVTICGRRAEKINAVAARLGDRCLAVTADITQPETERSCSVKRWPMAGD